MSSGGQCLPIALRQAAQKGIYPCRSSKFIKIKELV
ncbi:hypothetical protein SGRA_0146 [Saprospira grandis str. Lewin]|uniref:Uncharacterized protein n=1 Tax=Saprospira grandis (strain Lewin) TaxID=984262 RepID=H6L518_SAPGL|nr:hypothetical protein SGRA_0146 [Saprospira grandis str. Lewin]